MSEYLTGTIRESFEKKSTSELLRIWTENNRQRWSQTAFDVIEDILAMRKVPLPDQNPESRIQDKNRKRPLIAQAGLLFFMIGGLAFSVNLYQHGRSFMSFLFAAIPSIVFCFYLRLRYTGGLLIMVMGIVTLFTCSPTMRNVMDWLIGHLTLLSPGK